MIVRLLFWLAGYLEVRAMGAHCERLVNLAAADGIYLWDLRFRGDGIEFKVGAAAFHRLRRAVRRSRTRVQIVDRRGLPFGWRLVRRRRALLAGPVFVIALLLYVSSFVWTVDVRGTETVPEGRIESALREMGLHPGVPKGRVDLGTIAERLPGVVPGIAWASIRLEGTQARVEVVERLRLQGVDLSEQPADLVARRDALVTRVLALRGRARVQEGQTVRRGQLLVSGVMPAGGLAVGEEEAGPVRYVRARGEVIGRTWYEVYVEVPLEEEVRLRTGEHTVRVLIRAGGREAGLYGPAVPLFGSYERTEQVLFGGWRNLPWPLQVVVVRYDEVVTHRRKMAWQQAVRRAREEGERRLFAEMPGEARILAERVATVSTSPASVGVRVVIETEEPIAEVRPLRPLQEGSAGDGEARVRDWLK